MSKNFIPEHIDPFRYADQSLCLSGLVKYADMNRLKSGLLDADGAASVELEFGIDEQGLTFVKGNMRAILHIECQRCMQPFDYEVVSSFSLAVVDTLEDAQVLPEHYEPVLVKDGYMALRELIEDEIILNMPIIARHDEDDCSISIPLSEVAGQEEDVINPFGVLAELKSQ